MIRKTLFAVAAIAVAVLMAVVGLPTGVAQESETTDETGTVADGGVELSLGERFEGVAWDIEAQNLFLTNITGRAGWSEVRIGISLRNNGPDPLPFSSTAFFDGPGYPRIQLVDGNDVTRVYRMLRPEQDAIPNSNVMHIPADLTARWTVGFEVPTVNVGSMRLQLLDPVLRQPLASWTLAPSPGAAGWEPPPLDAVSVGETFPWGEEGLIVEPVQYGSLVCGDPGSQIVTQVFALQMDVTNNNFTDDLPFPGVRLPDTAAIAQWPDGSTSQMTYETFGGEAEVLRKFAADVVFIPPTDGEFFSRGLIFGVTRDGRIGPVDSEPQGVQLNRPDGTSLWLELDGLGDLLVNPRFCDRGFFEGPLVGSYAPVGPLDVGNLAPRIVTDAELDQKTSDVIVQAVIVVGEAAVSFEKDFTELTADDLNAIWPDLNFVDGLTLAAVGIIGTDVVSPTQVLLMTVSPTGRYYCAGFDVDLPAKLSSAEDYDSALNGCLPEDKSAEEEAGEGGDTGETGGTTTTTTTTTPTP